MSGEADQRLIQLCDLKRKIDDELGRVSDHEGGSAGPTFAMFKTMTAKNYLSTVDYYIGRHEAAIRCCKQLMKLRRANPPAE